MWPALLALLTLQAAPGPDGPAAETPAGTFGDTLVVTASRTEEPVAEAPALVTVVPGEEIRSSPSLTLDEVLRRVPGLALFRRASSVTAHPTTQGVSLRGIGPSGTSRALVLWDGLPLNDPFGGWVYWNRTPPASLEAVEVARGAGSPLYGSSALGGTIQLLSREPAESGDPELEATLRLGERGLADLELWASDRAGPWAWTFAGRSFSTDGHFLLAPEDRGAADRPAGVTFESLVGRLHRGPWHLGAQLYREQRGNGTGLQRNASRLATVEGGYSGERWSWSLYRQDQRLESTFSRVFPGRDREIRTAVQDIPAEAFGGSLLWRREPAGQGDSAGGPELLAGADFRRATWEGAAASEDGEGEGDGEGGGDLTQDLAGAFAQASWQPGRRWDVTAGLRFDLWENRSTQATVSPRLGALYRLTEAARLRASAYRGFRAPTLNELFRPFRVGNVVTRANPELAEERITGLEAGLDLFPSRGTVWGRVNAFWNLLDDPVGNVTLEGVPAPPGIVLRQRRNLGEVEVPGLELAAGGRLGTSGRPLKGLRWQLSYLVSDPEVEATGRRLPQVPRHRVSLRLDGGLSFLRPGIAWVLEGRWASSAFEDDLEQLSLGDLWVVDLAVRVPVRQGLALAVAAENLFDERFVAGRLPEERLGAPRTLWVALEMR